MNDTIKPLIHSVLPISQNAMEKLLSIVSYVRFDKGAIISTVGQGNKQEYFLLDGVCKSYLLNPEGDPVTISFFMSPSILSPHTTRISQGKSLINICACTEVQMAFMDAESFEKLMIDDLEIRNFGNTVLRNELKAKVEKELCLASLKGKERLLFLRKTYPNIENLVAHADIASYLGMTPISLSRLRTQS